MRLQEERKGFEQLEDEERDTVLAQIYPSLRQVISQAALCVRIQNRTALTTRTTMPECAWQCLAVL